MLSTIIRGMMAIRLAMDNREQGLAQNVVLILGQGRPEINGRSREQAAFGKASRGHTDTVASGAVMRKTGWSAKGVCTIVAVGPE